MLTLTKAVTVGQFCALKLPQSGSILRAQYQRGPPPRGQTEFQVNLKLGLTPCPPRMAFPELLPARVTYGVPVTLALGCPRNSRGTLGAARAALGSTD